MDASKREPMPTANDSTPIVDLVKADLDARSTEGVRKYGTKLQAHNGRNALMDAYQEALDLCMYLRQVIEEDEALRTQRDRAVALLQKLHDPEPECDCVLCVEMNAILAELDSNSHINSDSCDPAQVVDDTNQRTIDPRTGMVADELVATAQDDGGGQVSKLSAEEKLVRNSFFESLTDKLRERYGEGAFSEITDYRCGELNVCVEHAIADIVDLFFVDDDTNA